VHRNPPLIITYFNPKVNSFLKKTTLFGMKILFSGIKWVNFFGFLKNDPHTACKSVILQIILDNPASNEV
jgi:hypothetical protein